MTDTITLPRSVVEQALEAFEHLVRRHYRLGTEHDSRAKALRASLDRPKPLPSTVWRFVPTTMTDAMAAVDKELRHAVPWIRWEAILAAAPQPPRQPLTDAQINDHRLALPYDGEDLPDPWDFKQGVRAAERAHRIGGEA